MRKSDRLKNSIQLALRDAWHKRLINISQNDAWPLPPVFQPPRLGVFMAPHVPGAPAVAALSGAGCGASGVSPQSLL